MKVKKKNQTVYVLTLTESEAKILSQLANSVAWDTASDKAESFLGQLHEGLGASYGYELLGEETRSFLRSM